MPSATLLRPRLFRLACVVCAIKALAVAVACPALPNDLAVLRADDGFWPLVPYVLMGGLQKTLGGYRAVMYLAMAPLLASTVVPLWWTARRLRISANAYTLGVLAFASYPYLWVHIPNQFDTGFSVSLLIWSVGAFHCWCTTPSFGSALLCSSAFTLFLADRPQALTFLPWFIASEWWFRRPTERPSNPQWLTVGAMLVILLAGYGTLREARYGHFGLLSANGGYNFVVGNNPYTLPYLLRYDATLETPVLEHAHTLCPGTMVDTRASLEPQMRRCAINWASKHPNETLISIPLKIWRHFDVLHLTAAINSLPKNLIYTVPYLMVLICAGLATRRSWRNGSLPKHTCVALWTIAFVYALPIILTLPSTRLRMHTEVYWILLAATTWALWLEDWWSSRNTGVLKYCQPLWATLAPLPAQK